MNNLFHSICTILLTNCSSKVTWKISDRSRNRKFSSDLFNSVQCPNVWNFCLIIKLPSQVTVTRVIQPMFMKTTTGLEFSFTSDFAAHHSVYSSWITAKIGEVINLSTRFSWGYVFNNCFYLSRKKWMMGFVFCCCSCCLFLLVVWFSSLTYYLCPLMGKQGIMTLVK